jgi:hypothetical protein
MALGADAIHLLNGLRRMGYFSADPSLAGRSVVEIGAQQLAASFLGAHEALYEAAQLFDIGHRFEPIEPSRQTTAHGSLDHLTLDAPAAASFWHWLGFRYAAIDIDGSFGSIPIDLNYGDAPPELTGRFQLVTNFGTTEHIANQLNVFKVIHDLAAPAGLMVHQVPMQGMLNHGLINYNFKFFWMLCRGNGYRIVTTSISGAGNAYPMPQNIVDSVAAFDPLTAGRAAEYRFQDATLTIVLEKSGDAAYVPPLDVPTETVVKGSFAKRYWPAPAAPKVPSSQAIAEALRHCSGWELQRELLSRYRRRITGRR